MDYRFLGRTGVKVSRLAFGVMSFGGDADEGESGRLYARARDAGINLFDAADVYNQGRAEEWLGKFSAGHRHDVVLCSKAYFPTGTDPNARGSSRLHLYRAVEGSLRRLGTDRIDVFYLHRWDDATPLEESLRAIEDLVRQGKILRSRPGSPRSPPSSASRRSRSRSRGSRATLPSPRRCSARATSPSSSPRSARSRSR